MEGGNIVHYLHIIMFGSLMFHRDGNLISMDDGSGVFGAGIGFPLSNRGERLFSTMDDGDGVACTDGIGSRVIFGPLRGYTGMTTEDISAGVLYGATIITIGIL